jgi:drug/metabolite transporter (DMT)-like permease
MVGLRQLIAGTFFVLFFVFKKTKLPNRQQWIMILFLSVVNFVISQGLSTLGVKYTTAGLGAIIGAIFPLWLVLIIKFRGRTKLPPLTWVGLLIGFMGVCVVFYQHLQLIFNYSFLGGILLGLISSVTWAFGTIYTRDFALDYNPYFSIGWQMLIAGIVLTTVSTLTGNTIPLSEITTYAWAVILFLTIVSSIIAFIAFLYALQRLPTSLISIYAYINPIVAVFTGSLLIGEPLTFLIITGSVITLLGVYIVNKALQKQLYTQKVIEQ